MKKRYSMKVMIPVMAGVLVLLIVLKACGLLTFTSGIRIGFVGNNSLHTFSGSYLKLSGTTSHDLSPSKVSAGIHCEITTESGSIQVLITDKSDGTVIYEKEISGNETFDVPANGKVKIKLHTESHSGSYLFKY